MGTDHEYSGPAPSPHYDGDLGLVSFEGAKLLTTQSLPKFARVAALITFALGVIALFGWWLHFPLFESLWPGRPRMVPTTAFALVLAGFALWAVLPAPVTFLSRVRFGAGQVAGLAAAALGVVTLACELLRWTSPLTLALFHSGRPSYPTALCAVCSGLSILLLNVRLRGLWVSQLLAVLLTQVALLALIGHIFAVPELYGSLHFRIDTGMAVPTTLGFLLWGFGALCARPERGLMVLVCSNTPGGTLARRWLLIPGAVLLLMGLVYLLMHRSPAVERSIGSWLLLTTAFTALTYAVWGTAELLHRVGVERDQALHTIEKRVVQRTAELAMANQALDAARQALAHTNQKLERTVEQRTLHLQETVRSLETVCYNIAHDLRAPNRAIACFAQALLADHAASLDASAQDCLRRISAAALRSDELILDLLAYGRLGHAEMPCCPQSLEAHVQTAIDELSAASACVQVNGPLPQVWANPAALEQVVSNLLSNALKFVAEGRRPAVTIRAENAGSYCRVLIQDNGIGIAPEHQERIFKVFQRLHPPDQYPGTGIGLAIVQKSIQRMGGKLGVSSMPGKGSCFWFELPKPSES